MSVPFAVFVSRRLQSAAAAILCLAVVQFAQALGDGAAGPGVGSSAPAGVRGQLRR